MDDLVTWLRAQLDEDERIARAAIDPKHRGDWAWRRDSRSTVRERDGVPIGPEARGVEIGPHIARWNPARVLREVEAKRALLAACLEYDDYPAGMSGSGLAYHVEELLALPYADRPGYRDEWRP